MKTRLRNIIIVITTVSAIILTICASQFQINKSNTSSDTSEDNRNNKLVNKGISVSASYSYPFKTVKEMKSDSDAIVLATVINRVQYSDVAVKSTLAVSKTIKGKHLDQIYLFELGREDCESSEMLLKNTKYMLFLKHRWQDKPEIEDEFFITGGIVGIIAIDENTMHSYEPRMDKDLQKVLKDYDKSKVVDMFIEKMSEPDSIEEPTNGDATEASR